MGSMTLTEMRNATRWGLDNVGTNKVTEAQLTRWLNWSYQQVAMPKVHRHQSLQASTGNAITLVADQVTYDLSTLGYRLWGIYSAHYIVGTDSAVYSTQRVRLTPEDIRWFDQGIYGTGRPVRYAIWGGNGAGQVLHISSRPTSTEAGHVLQVRGYRAPDALSATDDTTALFDGWDEVVVLGARWRGWRELNRPERAEMARADFAAMIAEMQESGTEDAHDWGGRFELDLTPYTE